MKVYHLLQFFIFIAVYLSQIIKIPLTRQVNKIEKKNNFKIQRFLENYYSDNYPILDPNDSFQTYKYTAKIEVGKWKKVFKVAFDTRSFALELPSTNLIQNSTYKDLFQNGYDCQSSDGCNIKYSNTKNYVRDYRFYNIEAEDIISVSGLQATTIKICLIDKFLRKPINPYQIDGTVGLGYNNDFCENNIDQKYCLIQSLYKDQIIKEKMFSFYFGQRKEDNELIIGGFDQNKIGDTSQIHYHNINQVNGWELELTNFQFSNMSYEYPQLYNKIIIDSGINYIRLQSDLYEQFQQLLSNKYFASFDSYNNTFVSCSSDLPDLQFTISDYQGIKRLYTIPKSYYLYEVDNNQCFIMVKPAKYILNQPQSLGVPFLKRYVSIFYLQNKTVGLSLSKAAGGFVDNIQSQNSQIKSWMIFLIVTVCILIVGIALFLYKCIKRQRQQSINELSEPLSIPSQKEKNKSSCSSFNNDLKDIDEQNIDVNIEDANNFQSSLNQKIKEQIKKSKVIQKKQYYERTY